MISIPKPASTVVLMNHQSKIYLTKRPKTMKFLAGYYVFPGGAVDKEDAKIEKKHIKNWNEAEEIHLDHYVAAARELFEEVGVFLGRKGDGTTVQFTKETDLTYRKLLINRKLSFSEILQQENLYLDFSHLTYFGHRITPKESRIRYDTRFFLANLPRGQSPIPEQNEIDEAVWIDPDEAINAYLNGKMRMALPTLESLQTIITHQIGGDLKLPVQQ